MKPIAQSFMVFQQDASIDGVFLTQIKLYFKRASTKFGITLEIRTMENGFPTANIVPGGKSYMTAGQIAKSDDASVSTSFMFDSMPFLKTNTQYAMVLVPDGGNDEYDVWIARLGDSDITTKSQIFKDNQIGNLFIPSNDELPTAAITETLKYELYTAVFVSSNSSVYLRPVDTEYVKVDSVVGKFVPTEFVWVANNQISGYAQTTTNSTYVTVPNTATTNLTVNNWIYITTSDRSVINFRRVVNSAVNSTTIQVGANTTFTNSTCVFGRVHGDASLFASIKTMSQVNPQDELELRLVSTTANSTLHFANSKGNYIFGLSSNASAIITSVANKNYDALVPHVNYISPSQTAIQISYAGYSNSGSTTGRDETYIPAIKDVPNEFTDKERMLYSYSNGLKTAGIGSNASLLIKVDMSTSNNLTAPYIDRLGTLATLTYNAAAAETQLSGYYLVIANTVGTAFTKGQVITQNTTSGVVNGTVDFANSSFLRINSHTGKFTNLTINCVSSGTTANVTSSTYFDETLDNGYYDASRYISKNVILADQQDAEDLINFMTLYRPVGTNFKVYGKFLNASDPDAFNDKDWSYMPEFDATTALFSSIANREDYIDAQFGLPTSITLDSSGANVTTSSANVTVSDSLFYSANTFAYIYDNVNGKFNVRRISSVPTSTRKVITLESAPSFTSTNATVGIIPNLQSRSGAFLYDRNNNIIRYVTSTDAVYDTYKTFAVKIVPITNNSIFVPIMKSIKSLALQI